MLGAVVLGPALRQGLLGGPNPLHPWNLVDKLSKRAVRLAAQDVLNGEGAVAQGMMSMMATVGGETKVLQSAAPGGPKSPA